MANNKELALKFSYNRKSVEELQAIVESSESSETEKKVAQSVLDKKLEKMAGEVEAVAEKPAPKKKTVPVKKKPEPVVEEEVEEAEEESPISEEEQERLREAEAEFDERLKKRKSPSKKDKNMVQKAAPKPKVEKTVSKRENLDESTENPGLKVGSTVMLAGTDDKGTVVRLYRSSDGKEKCMVKIGDGKPVKKRVTAVSLIK